jgi:uncharacterized protein YrrD
MNESNQVLPVGSISGKTILSLESGAVLGRTLDILVDPANGRLLGLSLDAEGTTLNIPYEEIYSFGKDAVMAISDASITRETASEESRTCRAHDLIGTQVVLESGDILGEIADVLITLNPPPVVIYEVRRSLLDRFLGRTFFIPASVANVLSADSKRLLVPDITAEIATDDVPDLSGLSVDVRSFRERDDPASDPSGLRNGELDEDATVLRSREPEDDDTVMISDDEDETVLRRKPSINEN